jgi:hypothetical protein
MAIKPTLRFGVAAVPLFISLVLAGCQQEDEALRQWNRESTDRILQQNDKLVAGSQQLVEADALARREMADLHRELQQERVELGRQRDQLEEQRRSAVKQERRETILAAVIQQSVWLLLCCVPLVLCWYLLQGLRTDSDTSQLEEMLTVELVDERSVLAHPRRLTPLPAPDEEASATLTNQTVESD